MAGDIATRYVRIRPDAAGFKNDLNKQVDESLKGVKKTIATAIGGAGIYEVLKSTFDAAAGRQSAGKAVELAVQNAGAAWKVYGKTVEEVLEEQEHSKGFDFEDQGQAFGRIEQQTKDTKRSLEDLNLAMDVSRARHLALAQVAVALSRLEGGNSQSLSRLGITIDKYTGSVDKLKQAHDEELAAGQKFSKAQQVAYKDAIAAATASDKQASVERARAELLKRYGGQADAFAHTAAGSIDILKTSIQQAQEAIGTAFLPLLTEGARDVADWANGLANSESTTRKAATVAHDLGEAIHFVGSAIEAVQPLLSFGQGVVDTFGVGPILAFVAAWKLLPPILDAAQGGEASLLAENLALASSQAQLVASTDAFQVSLARLGVTEATMTAEQAALITSTEAQAAASAAAAVEAEAAAVAAEGAAAGFATLLGPIALLAGGLYFLNEHFKTVDHTASDFTDTVGKLSEAVRLASSDVTGAKITRDQAAAQREAATAAKQLAEVRVDADRRSGASADKLSADQENLRQATLNLRQANHDYASSVDAARQAERDRATGTTQSKAILASLTDQVVDLGKKSREVAEFIASHGGDLSLKELNATTLKAFIANLDELAKANPTIARSLEDLKGIAEATHKIPDKVTIGIILNPSLDGAALTEQIVAQISAAQQAAQAALSSGSAGLLRGGLKTPKPTDAASFGVDNKILYPDAEVVKKGAKKAAQTWSQEFVTHIDASSIGDAISSALSEARSNIVTQSDAIASAVGDALDERLRRTTLPLTRDIESLQASLDAEQAASAASDAADAVTKAQQKLDELRSVYGTGALTAGQSGEISDAQKAVADAQRQVADQAKQAQISSLQGQVDAAGKAEELRKSAVTRNLSDLADEFNRGKITQEKYLEGVRGILKDQQVDFKNAGQLLGTAFADGFKDSLSNLSQQVLLLTGGQRKGSTLTKPTSVTKAGADATQAILDQIAQSGGKFAIDNASSLPKGVNVGALVAAAKRTRDEDSYRVASGKAQQAQLVAGETTNRHLATIADLLRAGTHVVVDGSTPKKKTRATAKATQS